MRWKVIHLGTTSGRYATDEKLLDVFKVLADFTANIERWGIVEQLAFSKLLQEKKLYKTTIINESKLQKNARQISSIFVQLGFIGVNRKLTDLGRKVINGHYPNEILPIIKETQAAFLLSIFNFKDHNGNKVFKDFIKNISASGSMTKMEFANRYLIINPMTNEQLEAKIKSVLPIDNFQKFKILVHHQKGDTFNMKYYEFFQKALTYNGDPILLWNQLDKVSSDRKFRSSLKKIFFGTPIKREAKGVIMKLTENSILKAILLSKLEALICEYQDLAYRILRATGLFYFDANRISISNDFAKIVNEIGLSNVDVANSVNDLFASEIKNLSTGVFENIQQQLLSNRSDIFEQYLDQSLTKNIVVGFLNDMQENNWTNIGVFFKNSSTNPTYAEFIVSVGFHYISGRESNFIESWNGQIMADNRPFRHASGGVPDAAFRIKEKLYLIETTIQTGFQQMANEIAPISEHLFDSKGEEKQAHLFAKVISKRAIRQASIQRAAGVNIYTHVFSNMADLLQKNVDFMDAEKKLINV